MNNSIRFESSNIVHLTNVVKARDVSEEFNLPNGGYVLIVISPNVGVLGKFLARISVDCAADEIKFFDEKIKEGRLDIEPINEKEKELLNNMYFFIIISNK